MALPVVDRPEHGAHRPHPGALADRVREVHVPEVPDLHPAPVAGPAADPRHAVGDGVDLGAVRGLDVDAVVDDSLTRNRELVDALEEVHQRRPDHAGRARNADQPARLAEGRPHRVRAVEGPQRPVKPPVRKPPCARGGGGGPEERPDAAHVTCLGTGVAGVATAVNATTRPRTGASCRRGSTRRRSPRARGFRSPSAPTARRDPARSGPRTPRSGAARSRGRARARSGRRAAAIAAPSGGPAPPSSSTSSSK